MSSTGFMPFLVSVLLVASAAVAKPQELPKDENEGQPVVGHDGHFFIQSADGQSRLQFDGLLQPRFEFTTTASRPATDETEAKEATHYGALMLARARLGMGGYLLGKALSYRALLEFGHNNPAVLDYYLDYKFHDQFHLRIGQDRKPFSRSLLTAANKLQLVDRSDAGKEFAAGRDIGVLIHNDYLNAQGFEYAFGVYNGTGATAVFTGKKFDNVPEHARPTTVLRLGYSFGDVDGYVPSDLRENGAPGFAIAASGAADLDTGDAADGKIQTDVDFAFKAYGLGASGGFFASFQQDGDVFSDRAKPALGLYAQVGYVFQRSIEGVGGIDWMKDQVARTEKSGATVGVSVFFHGPALKWQNDATVFYDAIAEKSAGYQVRSQVQVFF